MLSHLLRLLALKLEEKTNWPVQVVLQETYLVLFSSQLLNDTLAEWLRRLTRNQLGSPA